MVVEQGAVEKSDCMCDWLRHLRIFSSFDDTCSTSFLFVAP